MPSVADFVCLTSSLELPNSNRRSRVGYPECAWARDGQRMRSVTNACYRQLPEEMLFALVGAYIQFSTYDQNISAPHMLQECVSTALIKRLLHCSLFKYCKIINC